MYSKTRKLTEDINMWTELIENEAHELNELSVIIKLMESPFGFIQGFQLDKKLLHTKIKTTPMENSLAAEL